MKCPRCKLFYKTTDRPHLYSCQCQEYVYLSDFFLLLIILQFKNTTRQSGDCSSYRQDGNFATDTIPVPTLNRLVKCNCQQCHTVWRLCTECGHRRINFYCFTGGQNNLHAHELVCDHCNFSRTLPCHRFDCPYI